MTTPHPGVEGGILRLSNPAPLVHSIQHSDADSTPSTTLLSLTLDLIPATLRPLHDVSPSDPPEPVAAGLVRWTVLATTGQHMEEPTFDHRYISPASVSCCLLSSYPGLTHVCIRQVP